LGGQLFEEKQDRRHGFLLFCKQLPPLQLEESPTLRGSSLFWLFAFGCLLIVHGPAFLFVALLLTANENDSEQEKSNVAVRAMPACKKKAVKI
jgi:hypothetical protein